MRPLFTFTVILFGALTNIQPTLAQSVDETIGFISEKLTAGHGKQVLTGVDGECSVSLRSKDSNIRNFDLKKLSKSSLRSFSVDDNSGPIIRSDPPKQWMIELQCFNEDCINDPSMKFYANNRKIEMIVLERDIPALTKAWTHLLTQCGAKERKQLF